MISWRLPAGIRSVFRRRSRKTRISYILILSLASRNSSVVERHLGKMEVASPILASGSRQYAAPSNADHFHIPRWYYVEMNRKKPRTPCRTCGKEPYGANYTYCSNACQHEYQFRNYVRRWQEGRSTGLQSIGIVSTYVKKYLRIKFDNKCCQCGWSEVNSKTGIVPLVADHIDGNWRNNREGNLRLLCPNCDALSPTYAGLNRGNGRMNRVRSRRAQEGRIYGPETGRRSKIRIEGYVT